jgi:hypothetical protein
MPFQGELRMVVTLDANIQIPIIDNCIFSVNLRFLILGFESTCNKFSFF